jgi:DNA-binding SARP family transcriptional activator
MEIAPGTRRSPLVDAKLGVPAIADQPLERTRLNDEIARLLGEHRVVGVWATAGAGKTTAVRQAVVRIGRPIAWLTLDPSDAAPGRLLVYLEAALCRALPDTTAVTGDALSSGVLHIEAAAMLAQAVRDREAILVLDEVERIADSSAALEVISSFVRYADPATRVLLVGRRRIELDAVSRIGYGAVGCLGEEQLAFDGDEAASALALRGITETDAQSVVRATGGWVTGVLFEAWRSREHVGGAGGEADALAGYLSAEILDGLRADERELLVTTSLWVEVDAARAQALGIEHAADILARLRAQYLPVVWRDDSRVLRCHPRFRDYLRSLLNQRDTDWIRDLRRRHGLELAREGADEESLAELLAAGWIGDALAPARRALPAAIARLDLDLAQGWLDRFDAAGLLHDRTLLRAQLDVAIAREEFQRVVDVADLLRGTRGLEPDDPDGFESRALAAWGYWHVGRLTDMRTMLEPAPPGHVGEVMRYLRSLLDDDPPASIPQLAGGPLDALILRISFARGRLTDVRDAPLSRWTPGITERASALRALGDLEQTATMLDERPGALANLRFEATLTPELLIDLGHEALAREGLLRARTTIVRSRSVVLDIVTRLLAAKLELRLRRDAATALEILRGIEVSTPVAAYRHLAEQLDMWTGCAQLIAERDGQALTRLLGAVSSMRRADRVLELPTAAIYLAEAHERAGRRDLADGCADLALEASGRLGSRHLLLGALDDFPAVLTRRMDAEDNVDGVWHGLGRALAARARAIRRPPFPRLRLRDLGPPELTVDGEARRVRIGKSYALLAYLVHVGGRATRTELLDALFDGRDDDSARAYLRQAAQVLREVLPAGLELLRDGDAFVLEGAAAVETETMLLDARLVNAGALIGAARLKATQRVIDACDGAIFLKGIDCRWVTARREEIDAAIADALIDVALVAFELSRLNLAREALAAVLDRDPLREQAWRLLMRVSASQGLDDRVIEAYRQCETTLGAVGLEPAPSTRLLVQRLRR